MDTLNIDEYFSEIRQLLFSAGIRDQLLQASDRIKSVKEHGGKLLLFGNGGSAGIVAHAAVDFTKQANVNAQTYHEPAFVTALANDIGYDKWVEVAVKKFAKKEDLAIFVSVSGASPNLVNGCLACQAMGIDFLTFTGTQIDNKLYDLDPCGFFVDSKS